MFSYYRSMLGASTGLGGPERAADVGIHHVRTPQRLLRHARVPPFRTYASPPGQTIIGTWPVELIHALVLYKAVGW